MRVRHIYDNSIVFNTRLIDKTESILCIGSERVLDAQQALFRQQNTYVQNRGLSARNVVAIYKALGGGWEVRQGKAFVDENTLTVMRERTNWGSLLDDPVTEEANEDGMRRPDW